MTHHVPSGSRPQNPSASEPAASFRSFYLYLYLLQLVSSQVHCIGNSYGVSRSFSSLSSSRVYHLPGKYKSEVLQARTDPRSFPGQNNSSAPAGRQSHHFCILVDGEEDKASSVSRAWEQLNVLPPITTTSWAQSYSVANWIFSCKLKNNGLEFRGCNSIPGYLIHSLKPVSQCQWGEAGRVS